MSIRLTLIAMLVLLGGAATAQAEDAMPLTVYAAGTLAVPFREIGHAFEQQHPGVAVQAQFGGSVMMAKRLTDLGQRADVYAAADYSVIPSYLFGSKGGKKLADWYVGFARNAITFVYTAKSKGAGEITARNWYEVLARPGIEIGRSNPDTDPSGYQTVQMLSLAEGYYHRPGLAQGILANAPPANMRDTETALLAALQLGQIDYLAIYRSDALQHHLESLALPAAIDLGDPALAAQYAAGVAVTRNGTLHGKPIVYAVTIPNDAPHPALAAEYVALLLGPAGAAILQRSGFGSETPGIAVGGDKLPAPLRALVKPWPQG